MLDQKDEVDGSEPPGRPQVPSCSWEDVSVRTSIEHVLMLDGGWTGEIIEAVQMTVVRV